MFEAGLFPGYIMSLSSFIPALISSPSVAYYLSCWYKRSELGIRAAAFFAAATASGAFGGLLAAVISNMGGSSANRIAGGPGVGGKPAWAWIFILEGLATIVAGVMSFWIVQDFPDTAKFLREGERAVVVRRLQKDDQFSAAGEDFGAQKRAIWEAVVSPRTWLCMVLYAGADMPLYAFSLFLPSIINEVSTSAIWS
jgi:sugar phosphate permease